MSTKRALTITLLIILQITGFPFQDLVLVNAALAPIQVKWHFFEPAVIRTDATDSVDFKVKIDGGPSSVQLELANGTITSLTDEGDGRWGITLTAAQALDGYQPDDDANHNFVGFLDVFSDGTRIERRNVFVNVLDKNIPDSTILTIGPTVQISNHVINIWKPNLDLDHVLQTSTTSTITQQFYENFEDDFDFINLVFTLPSFPENRFHFMVQNNVEGIGSRLFNNAAVYGSNGRLQGITLFPIDFFFDLAVTAAVHEIGHQWINFLTLPILGSGSPHWPVSSLARGIMGVSIPGSSVGGNFHYNLVPLPNGDYRLEQTPALDEFTDLDLYLMGLLPASQVGSHIVFANQNQQICNGCILSGPVTVTVDDVIAAQGPRRPDVSTSQKTFRVATIIVTKERPLNDNELALFDYFAARGESTVPLPFSSGFEKGITKPFFLATGGRASLVTCIVAQCSREVAIDIRPRSDANKINPNSSKNINVAIFSANGFDATTVDPNTVRFGATGTEAAPIHVALRDINEDGLFDMVLRFQIPVTGIKCGDTSAVLTGQISGGPSIIGSSPIQTVQCGN